MTDILQYRLAGGKNVMVYTYKTLRDIDDVILQLLNESAGLGFIKGRISGSENMVVYDPEGLVSFADLSAQRFPRRDIARLLTDFYNMAQFLEDSFIDMRYIVVQKNAVFIDQEERRLHLAVLPCSGEYNLPKDVLGKIALLILDTLAPDQDEEWQINIRNAIDAGISDLDDLQKVIEYAQVPEDEMIMEEAVESISQEEESNAEAEAVAKEAQSEHETALDTETETEAVPDAETKTETEAAPDTETETEAAPDTEADEEVKTEAEAETKIEAEAETETEPEVKADARTEDSSEEAAGPGEETARESTKAAYLIRKKTGEVIYLNETPFVIGKIPFACDYVVEDNPAISRIHAIIRYNRADDNYYIIDCNSTNHIYLEGRRIAEDRVVSLQDKMRIHLATEEFIFKR